MGRRAKKNKNKYLAFLISFIMILSGVLYFGLNYVPKKLYETQTMAAGKTEAYYVTNWCHPNFGQREFLLWDKTRVDCLTKDYAIEFDFAKKWAESAGQALYYGKMTGKKPAVVLILEAPDDLKYVKRVERISSDIQIFLVKAF